MSVSPAERLLSLNRQAIAILRLDIPLDFGLGPDTEGQLREINDRLILNTERDLSADALLEKHAFPQRYQAIAQMLLATDDPAPIFESIALQELERDLAINPFRQAMTQPLIVAGLAYLGMIYLCSYTLPHIEDQYTQQGIEPTGATELLIQMRGLMPYWIIGFPILLLATLLIWKRTSRSFLLRFFPGAKPYTRWLAAESQTKRLAVLVGSDVDQQTAISLATSSTMPQIPLRPIAESILQDGDQQSQSRVLKRLAQFYQFLAEDRRRTTFAKTPALIGLLIAGFFVLGYALATFLPWIEILTNLSGPGDA